MVVVAVGVAGGEVGAQAVAGIVVDAAEEAAREEESGSGAGAGALLLKTFLMAARIPIAAVLEPRMSVHYRRGGLGWANQWLEQVRL